MQGTSGVSLTQGFNIEDFSTRFAGQAHTCARMNWAGLSHALANDMNNKLTLLLKQHPPCRAPAGGAYPRASTRRTSRLALLGRPTPVQG